MSEQGTLDADPANGRLYDATSGLAKMGAVVLFLARVLRHCAPALAKTVYVLAQIYNAGALSLVVVLCALFVGLVVGLQGYSLLQRFGSESALGVAVALGLVRELGPMMTAILFAGRVGTSIASAIGLMGATDQFAAMEMMAVDPVRLVIAPRFLGGLVAMPLLTAIFTCTGIFGGHLFGVTTMGIESGTYWSQMQSAVQLRDVTEGLLKSALFGVTCSLIAVYEGFHAEPTAAGVALATTRTVVGSTVFTLILDYLLTAAFI